MCTRICDIDEPSTNYATNRACIAATQSPTRRARRPDVHAKCDSACVAHAATVHIRLSRPPSHVVHTPNADRHKRLSKSMCVRVHPHTVHVLNTANITRDALTCVEFGELCTDILFDGLHHMMHIGGKSFKFVRRRTLRCRRFVDERRRSRRFRLGVQQFGLTALAKQDSSPRSTQNKAYV
jgi:hypothetical protein